MRKLIERAFNTIKDIAILGLGTLNYTRLAVNIQYIGRVKELMGKILLQSSGPRDQANATATLLGVTVHTTTQPCYGMKGKS